MTTRLTGRIAADRIGTLAPPELAADLLAGFRALDDLTSALSDILDELGLMGAVPASLLRPPHPGARIVGRAITVENDVRPDPVAAAVATRDNRLADLEAHNLAEPGDVLVVRGIEGISSMGRVSARIGLRQGELGAIVDGSVRDIAAVRDLGYPIWARSASPLTGKHRLETIAINREVEIAGVLVSPGDLVAADEAGVVFVPHRHAATVLRLAQQAAAAERGKLEAIDRGVPLPDLPGPRRV